MNNKHQQLFLFKRLIVEAEWWLRDNVLCNGNFLYHTEAQVTAFIESIRDRIAELPMPDATRYADIAASTIFLIAKQRNWNEYLEYELISPLRLFSDIEAITRQTENHHSLQKPLQVKYHYGTDHEFIDEARLNPAEVVCVLSFKKDDKRIILERKEIAGKPVRYNTYILDKQYLPNGKSLNFDSLRYYLDPIQIHLIATNNSIFNEAYYDFDGDNIVMKPGIKLNVNIKDFDIDRFKEITLNKRSGDKKKIHQDLITCRENKWNHFNSLQNLSSFYSYHKSKLNGI